MLVLPSSRPSYAQTISGQGFSELVCILGVGGNGIYGRGELIVTVEDDTGSTATVTIQHGETSSTHTVTYEDTDVDGVLDCGDIILSVSR